MESEPYERKSFEDWMNDCAVSVGYVVAVVAHETEMTVKTFDPLPSERQAERLQRGIDINLDHARFYTEIREQ